MIAEQVNISSIGANDTFDIIVGYRRAATGEVQVGDLMYAGLDRQNGKSIQMLKWGEGSDSRWYEASGVGENRGEFARPVPGMVSSSYGARRHPILGYTKMHTGVDWATPYGAPIFASGNGVVEKVGWEGGYGKYVRLKHNNGYETAYGHMSAFAKGMEPGKRVRQGQVIGYVGSTGLSTGAHLHYEVIINGHFVDPMKIRVPRGRELDGRMLTEFTRQREQIETTLQKSRTGVAMAQRDAPR